MDKNRKQNEPTSNILLYQPLPVNIYGKPSENNFKELMEHVQQEIGHRKLMNNIDWLGFRLRTDIFPTKKFSQRKTSKYLSRKERIDNDLLKLPKTGWNYESLQEMRNMWNAYMSKIVVSSSGLDKGPPGIMDSQYAGYHNQLAKVDLIGGDITVIQSRAPNLVDLSGTVVLETKQTFQIVTKDNKLKILLKEPSIFELYFGNHKFTIFGKSILTRPHERCVKKIKSYINMDL